MHLIIDAHVRDARGDFRTGIARARLGTHLIDACELPDHSLLQKYRQSDAYTDCYVVRIDRSVSQSEYVEAFYTTWIFKLERWLLARFVSKPSTDAQAGALAAERSDSFAAWRVEGRTSNQLLMCDFQGRTRSWLMSVAETDDLPARTVLYFGSAVVPVDHGRSARRSMGLLFRALLGFHKVYSRVLLRAAVSRLGQRASDASASAGPSATQPQDEPSASRTHGE